MARITHMSRLIWVLLVLLVNISTTTVASIQKQALTKAPTPQPKSTATKSTSASSTKTAVAAATTTKSSSIGISTTPTTIPKDCSDLPPLLNGIIDNTSLSSTATFSCFYGYKLEGKSTLTCQANGTWDNKSPTCEVLNCETPQDPNNGLAIFNSTHVNSTVTYSCNDGYHLFEFITQTCKEMSDKVQGSWDGDPAECVINECEDLTPLLNGTIQYSSQKTIATLSCYYGYKLVGETTLRCQANRTWDAKSPNCAVLSCDRPQDPNNGQARFDSTNVNSTVTYSCNGGYHLSTNVTQTCKETSNKIKGSWEGDPAKCVINERILLKSAALERLYCSLKQ